MLDDDERRDQRGGAAKERERRRGAPAVAGGARQRVDEQHQPARDGGCAGEVEVAMTEVGPALAQQDGREQGGSDADRNVDEEDPRPAEVARQDAAQQHAGGRAASGGCAVDAEREVAVASFGEQGHEERERRRREQCPAEPLDGAERDQRALRPGDPAEQRAHREEEESADEQAAPAEEVRQPAAEEQRAAEEDRVRGDDPLQARLRKAEVRLDRRQGDVDDRHVEDDHELRRDDESQAAPPPSTIRSASHQLTSKIVDVDNDSRRQP